MTHRKRFEIQSPQDFPDSEPLDAKRHWSSLGVQAFYAQPETHWSLFMAEQILQLKPRSVLEFGCNVGRNLLSLRNRDPSLILQGVDINKNAVEVGRRERGLNLLEADEAFLQRQTDGSFDVVFTVSVLDHLPHPKPVLLEMVRVAGLAVLLLEPSLELEGKVVKSLNAQTGEILATTPYSYCWDYSKLSAGLPVEFSQEAYPLSRTNLGPYYWLFRLVKKSLEHPPLENQEDQPGDAKP